MRSRTIGLVIRRLVDAGIARSSLNATEPFFGASLTGQAFPERDPVGRGAKQQDGVVGRGDAISHYQGVEVDRLTGHALLLWRRLGDGEGARGEMLAGLRPSQRRVVLRVAGL